MGIKSGPSVIRKKNARPDCSSGAMNKRTFLKICSAAMTSPFLSRLAAWASEEKLHNWAGNVEYGHDRVRNKLREVVPDSREQRLGAAQFGVIAAHFRGGRMLDGHTRLWREERQPVHGGFGAGDRERGGRSGEAFARERRRHFSRSGGQPRRVGGGDQGDAGPAAQLPDAAVRLRKSA